MNVNLLHNILNIVMIVVGALAVPDVINLISPAHAAEIMTGVSALKLVMNALSDGLVGMTQPQTTTPK